MRDGRIRPIIRIVVAAATLLLCSVPSADAQKFEGLALTPPMGWNSWNHFGCRINEQIVRETAEAMISSGMKDAGYQYVNIDDCWHAPRDEQGNLQPDPNRFPSGMKALADYVHGLGLKFGIYSDAGHATCGGWPGSRGYEDQDARRFAEWGVDYLKYDWCDTDGLDPEEAYGRMSMALAKAGRPVVFSVCEWGINRPWEWAPPLGHLWRTTGDITNCFDCVVDHGSWYSWGAMQILDQQVGLRQHAGPGQWNDPDMMEVGNGLTDSENRAHFTMWSMLAAPLIAGNDIRSMTDETRAVLINAEVIAVDQDPLGSQGFRYREDNGVEIWFKPLAGRDWAMAILNRDSVARMVRFDWSREQVFDDLSHVDAAFDETTYDLRDLWKKEDVGSTAEPLSAEVPSHDVVMLRLNAPERADKTPHAGPDMRLYPDPASTYVSMRLRTDEEGLATVKFYDALGRLVLEPFRRQMPGGRFRIDILLESVSPGTYLVQLTYGSHQIVRSLRVVR